MPETIDRIGLKYPRINFSHRFQSETAPFSSFPAFWSEKQRKRSHVLTEASVSENDTAAVGIALRKPVHEQIRDTDADSM